MGAGCQVYKLKPEAHTQAAAPPKGAERIKTTWGYPPGHAAASATRRHAAMPPAVCRTAASLQSVALC